MLSIEYHIQCMMFSSHIFLQVWYRKLLLTVDHCLRKDMKLLLPYRFAMSDYKCSEQFLFLVCAGHLINICY